MKLSLKMVIIKFNMQLRYAMLLLPLVLVGAGCVEGMVRSSSDAFLDVGIDGMGVLMEEAPGLMDQVMDEYEMELLAQTNGVWTYEGNTISSEMLSFTTFFDIYVDLEPTDDPYVIRVQNYDPLLDTLIEGTFFAWVDFDAVVDSEFFEVSYDQLEDIELDGRTWVMGSNSVSVGELPVRGYRYDDGEYRFEILVFTNDEQGLERAQEFVQTLEFVE